MCSEISYRVNVAVSAIVELFQTARQANMNLALTSLTGDTVMRFTTLS